MYCLHLTYRQVLLDYLREPDHGFTEVVKDPKDLELHEFSIDRIGDILWINVAVQGPTAWAAFTLGEQVGEWDRERERKKDEQTSKNRQKK